MKGAPIVACIVDTDIPVLIENFILDLLIHVARTSTNFITNVFLILLSIQRGNNPYFISSFLIGSNQ